MFELADITAHYGAHCAVRNVSLQVGAGEVVVLLGANGAGKTTLLKAAAGILPVSPSASIVMSGRDISGLPAQDRVAAGMALVPEGRGIFPELNVRDNLVLGAYTSRARAGLKTQMALVLNLFPRLSERLRQSVRTMSGGEQQMVAIGRALMSQPNILLLDEPSLGLSPLLSGELFKSIARIKATGVAVLLVEQNVRLGLEVADRGYLIVNGSIGEGRPARELADDPSVQAAFLGG